MAASVGPIGNVPGSSQKAGDKAPQHVLITDSSGNVIESFGGSGGTAVADGATFTANTTQGTPAMGAYESTPTTVTDGDVAVVGITANRELKVSVTSGGTAGTQYTEGDTDATITGTALMLEGAANTLVAAPGTAADGLLVNLGGNNDVTVTGSVTANAGTNLNTSALALEAGGNLAAAATSLSVLDDWDETDRAKVNLIVGQAGVAAGAGSVGATVQRVTLASDDPAVTSLGAIDNAAATIATTGVLRVAIFDNADTQITTFGGGTQYTEGDTDATITGTALLMEGAANALVPAQGTAADGLLVNLGANNDVTVTNAGTFAVQVDGAALTALQLIDDPVATLGTTTYTETSTKGMIVGAVRRDADTTLVDTTNEVGPLQMDANGRLKVEAFSGETLPVSLSSVPSHAVTNAGTFAVQVDGAALTALQLIDNPVLVDDAAFTPATSSVSMAGFQADEASTDSVDEGDAGAARMTLDRKVIVQPQPHTAGGLSIFRSLDLDETEEDVKTSAGQVYGVWFTNTATSTRWLKFYNATAANVTVGTTTPVITLALPGNTSDDISGVFSTTMGITFDTAICVAATTGVADNDTGAPAANDVIVNIFYK